MLRDERGQALVVAALLMVALLGVVAFAVDLGTVSFARVDLQNAADAAALAGAQALPNTAMAANAARTIAAKNGADNAVVSVPYGGDATMVEVVCTKTVSYTFARVLGFEQKTVSARAVAQKQSVGMGAFGYAVFSGDTNEALIMSAGNYYINGDVHSNGSAGLGMYGSGLNVTGSVEAVGNLSISGSSINISGACIGATVNIYGSNITTGPRIQQPSKVIGMPDFSQLLKAQAEAAGQVYVGNKVLSGSNISVNTPIYVQGNVTVSGSSFTGKGCVLATGDITFSGSGINSSAGDAVCFYSKNGNITISGSNIAVEGIVYAPNGRVSITGSNVTIRGRVVGKTLGLYGSAYKIISGSGDFNSLPAGALRLVE
jgi:hypothetical protein